jgi:hypothetical protein
MKLIARLSLAAVAAFSGVGAHANDNAYTAEDVEKSFHPYKDWTPEFAGYEPGMIINASNVDQFKDILDPGMYDHLKQGRFEMMTKKTQSLDLHPNYEKATLDAVANPPQLNAQGLLDNFIAGRAFPKEPDANDPNAGLKLAWNYQYGYNWGDNAAICPFYWKYKDMKSGKLERTIKWCFHFLNWMHRVNQDPVPEFTDNPGKLFRSIYAKADEPFDLRNTQLLIHRYSDDLKRDDAWLYLGFQRRVRRLATGQTTDSFLGTDVMIEDFEGYNGRVSDYNWKYLETKNVLLPYHNHNELELSTEHTDPDGYNYIDFGGVGNCFAKTTWELRKVYVVEGTPKDPNHPLSKRILNMDVQTATINQQADYDRKGDFWKTFTICKSHPDFHHPANKGSGVSLDNCFSIVDVQAQHCTTGQFKGLIIPEMNPPQMFTVQNLRKSGQ